MQGAGAIGVAGIAGNAIISASENGAAALQDGESAALRVAHASPDTPTVDVQVEQAGAMAGGAGGDGGNATGGNETGGDGTPTDGGDGPMVEGLGFREVSDYNEVDPGTYQVRVVATENTGLLESIFGGDQEERVVFDEELELEQGTTYTAVAFGELAQTEGLGEQADDEGTTPTDDGVGEDTPTEDGVGEDTPTDDGAVGEDTPTDDGAVGEDTPTDDAATPTDDGAVGEDTPTDDGTTPEAGDTADGQVVIEELGFGEADSFELEANDYTLEFREAQQTAGDAVGDEVGTPTEDGVGEDTPTEDGVGEDTPTDDEDDTVGEDTPTDDETTPTDDGAVGEDTPTDDGMTPGGAEAGMQDMGFQVKLLEDDLSAPGGAGGEAGADTPADDGTATPAGNETNGNETDGDDGGILGGGDDQEGPFRLRIFHAVPDVDALEVVAMESEGGGLLGGGGDENETGGTPTPDGAAGNDTGAGATPDDAAGNDTGGAEPGGTPAGTPGAGAQEDSVKEADISPNGNTVYSGFAVGYFDPQAAAGEQTPAGNATGGVGDNATGTTPTDDGAVGEDTPTEDGNVTGGDGTETETPDEITEDVEGEEFELVTVQDWSDGERADGGTGGGGILPAAAPPEAASD